VTLLFFLIAASTLNIGLGIAVQLRRYQKRHGLIFLGASFLIVSFLWAAWTGSTLWGLTESPSILRLLLCLDLLISACLLQISRYFFHHDDIAEPVLLGFGGKSPWYWIYTCNAFALLISALPIRFLFDLNEGLLLSLVGSILPAVILLNTVATLYLVENTYRFAQEYQRRIGRLVFIGLFWIGVFHVLTFGRAILFRSVHDHYAEASSVVYGIVFPVILLGFLRYRLGTERISIPRDTIYTSVTLFMVGAAFLGVAVTVMVFQTLRMDFTQFELYLAGFSLCFIAVLALGSGTMRRRISRFVNARLYSSKYDYQEQFFRLHKSMTTEGDVGLAVTDLIENMKYTVSVDDALCFLRNPQDGDFYVHQNKEASFRGDLKLSGDSPLVRVFEVEGPALDFLAPATAGSARLHEARGEPLLLELKLDAAIAIRAGEELVGILGMQGGRTTPFDTEDIALIEAFATSIGNVVFKSRVLEARIEQKQFESFHHIASFIIHDIKNQIATLNLLLRNADKNLENPAFQKSMLTSVRSSASALQGLIDRLSVAPRQQQVESLIQPVWPVLEDVVQNSGLRQIVGLKFELLLEVDGRTALPPPVPGYGAISEDGKEAPWSSRITASFEKQSLFFVVKNLAQNALEAMGNQGELILSAGSLAQGVPEHLRALFGGGGRFFSDFSAYVLVRDHGPGMDEEFMRKRLFQPFATTKEKGVGIGLYQCKTLMEKMGGRILCRSQKGQGTTFCLLLAARSQANYFG
jgi:signal transduction histidine kinase